MEISERNGHLMRWRMCFREFHFDVNYNIGPPNTQDDALFRLHSLEEKAIPIHADMPRYPLHSVQALSCIHVVVDIDDPVATATSTTITLISFSTLIALESSRWYEGTPCWTVLVSIPTQKLLLDQHVTRLLRSRTKLRQPPKEHGNHPAE